MRKKHGSFALHIVRHALCIMHGLCLCGAPRSLLLLNRVVQMDFTCTPHLCCGGEGWEVNKGWDVV